VNTDGDYLDIYTKWGRMPVHKHWLDSVDVIVARATATRKKGTWNRIGGEWVFIVEWD
jgi:hypothetical protein